jgi:hypothetical protein
MGSSIDYPERRLEPRTVLRFPGTITAQDGTKPLPCVVVDMSRTGASIRAHDLALPDEFVLSLNANASVQRHCKVIWRDAFMVGVQFVERKEERAVKQPIKMRPPPSEAITIAE